MSSSIDVGLNYRESNKIIQKECEKSSDGKHKWEITCGSWPSVEQTCKHCKQKIYSK